MRMIIGVLIMFGSIWGAAYGMHIGGWVSLPSYVSGILAFWVGVGVIVFDKY